MQHTSYRIAQMDCSSEEQMVRMCLEGLSGVERLAFDLGARRLDVYHHSDRAAVLAALDGLRLGATEIEHTENAGPLDVDDDTSERRPLFWALVINAALFLSELVAGVLSGSMGLVADSIDMLADALVYALSLAAVGGTAHRKRKLAAGSGYLQITLALFGLGEVARRFVAANEAPDVGAMIVVSLIALAGNLITLLLLRRTRRDEAHIQASWIFTSNDVKVNLLVIAAGLLVWWTSSRIPDLLAGALIFLIVAQGARRILVLARAHVGTH